MADDELDLKNVPWGGFPSGGLSGGPLAPAKAPEAKPTPSKPEERVKDQGTSLPTPQELIPQIGAGAAKAEREVAALNAQTMQMKPPELKLPPKPDTSKRDPINMWGSMAIAFAGLAGLMSRRHATTALGAAAAALEGIQKGDKARADEQYKLWEAESDNMIKVANFQEKAYNAILGNLRHSEDAAVRKGTAQDHAVEAKLKATATALQDPIMADALQRGGWPEAARLQKIRDDQAKAMEEHKLEVSKNFQMWSQTKELHDSEEYKAASPMEKAEMNAKLNSTMGGKKTATPLTPQQIDFFANQVANYEMLPGQFTRRQPGWNDVLMKAKQINPEWVESNYPIFQKDKNDLSTGKSAQTLKSLVASQQHLQYMSELAEALGAGDVRAANDIAQRFGKATGHPEVTNFEMARQIVGPEIAKSIIGGGASAVHDREEIKKQFEAAASPEQLRGAVKVAKDLIGGQVHALDQQFSSMPKKMREQFIKPEILEFYGAGKPGESKAGGAGASKESPIRVDKNDPATLEALRNAKPEAWIEYDGYVGQKKEIRELK